jgi:hypothetical protein
MKGEHMDTNFFSLCPLDWGISFTEYWCDLELRAAVKNIMHQFPARRSMEERISLELSRRAQCGGLTDEGNLRLAALRDRSLMLSDYAFFKEQYELFGVGTLPSK